MIVECEGCSTRFRLADEKIPARGARVRCSRCGATFRVQPPAAGLPASDEPSFHDMPTRVEPFSASFSAPGRVPPPIAAPPPAAGESGAPDVALPRADQAPDAGENDPFADVTFGPSTPSAAADPYADVTFGTELPAGGQGALGQAPQTAAGDPFGPPLEAGRQQGAVDPLGQALPLAQQGDADPFGAGEAFDPLAPPPGVDPFAASEPVEPQEEFDRSSLDLDFGRVGSHEPAADAQEAAPPFGPPAIPGMPPMGSRAAAPAPPPIGSPAAATAPPLPQGLAEEAVDPIPAPGPPPMPPPAMAIPPPLPRAQPAAEAQEEAPLELDLDGDWKGAAPAMPRQAVAAADAPSSSEDAVPADPPFTRQPPPGHARGDAPAGARRIGILRPAPRGGGATVEPPGARKLPDRPRRAGGAWQVVSSLAILAAALAVFVVARNGTLRLDPASVAAAFGLAPAPHESALLPLRTRTGRYPTAAGEVLYASGAIANRAAASIGPAIRVVAEVVDGDRVVARASTWAGGKPTPEEVHGLRSPEQWRALVARGAARWAAPLAPGAEAPWLVVLGPLPDGIAAGRLRLRVAAEAAPPPRAPMAEEAPAVIAAD